MKRNDKKKIALIFLMFVIFTFSFTHVYAGNTGGGSSSIHGDCPGCEWFYQSKGVRLSLYRYDGTNLAYYGSVDYCSKTTVGNSNSYYCPSGNAYQHEEKIGKIAYQQISKYKDKVSYWSNNMFAITVNTSSSAVFPNYMEAGWESIENYTLNLLGLNTSNPATVLEKIKKEFSPMANNLTVDDLGMIYITIEPTLNIGSGSLRYYGTAYELAEYFRAGDDLTKYLNKTLYYDFPSSIMAEKIEGEVDSYHFIGKYVTLVPTNNLTSSVSTTANRKANVEKILSTDGYGINVFWMGNYITPVSCTITESANGQNYTLSIIGATSNVSYGISNIKGTINGQLNYTAQYGDAMIYGTVKNTLGNTVATCSKERSVQTCKVACTGKSGDSLLSCAENYCQASSGNSSDKKSCITTCGYTEPSFSSCSSSVTTSGIDTTCSDSTSASKTTCTPANTNTYFKTTCTESSTITYGDSLPRELIPGAGFSYTPVLSGSKTCQMTFEVNKWKFDYASAYTDSERNRLLNLLKNFQDISDNSSWAKDINNTYKYQSDNANMTMVIDNGDNKTTTRTLEAQITTNLLNKDINVSSGGSITIPLFANGSQNYQTIFGLIRTNSSNQSAYRLSGICINGASGSIYELNNLQCNSSNDGPYYQYFTNLKIQEGSYDTLITVEKNSSNLNVDNSCYYSIETDNDDSLSCSVIYENGIYQLVINNKYNVNISYGISNVKNTINHQLQYTATSSNTKVYGSIQKGDTIVATCEDNKQGPPSDEPENSCVTLYKASEYDKINSYCTENWMNDIADYASAKDCYYACSIGNNTCKTNHEFSCSDLSKVIDYCENNYSVDGYYSAASCINDCSCFGDNGSGNYIYRPISLVDPFPNNRLPGYNWYGKEIYITDDLLNPVLNSGATPEYVIELTPNRISTIKANTKLYNNTKGQNAYIDYVYQDEYQTNGKYESKFIHVNDTADGGFYSYFTIIEGKGV